MRGNNAAARYLARCAQLEAASIEAFEILAAELKGFGAPRQLVLRARRAARDEVRHAKTMTALAGGPGALSDWRRAKCKRRSLRAVAVENAVEGCVRETFGALVASWQAKTARNPDIRQAMRRIAADETRHAQLAWDIQRWMDGRLSWAARCAVKRARRRAFETLSVELEGLPAAPANRELGLPPMRQAIVLLDKLAYQVNAWENTTRSAAA